MYEIIVMLCAIVALGSFSALMGVLIWAFVKCINEDFKDDN